MADAVASGRGRRHALGARGRVSARYSRLASYHANQRRARPTAHCHINHRARRRINSRSPRVRWLQYRCPAIVTWLLAQAGRGLSSTLIMLPPVIMGSHGLSCVA